MTNEGIKRGNGDLAAQSESYPFLIHQRGVSISCDKQVIKVPPITGLQPENHRNVGFMRASHSRTWE